MPHPTKTTLAELREHAGFISARRTAKNKGWNVLYRAEEQGIAPEDGGKYAIVCEEHSSLVQCTNLRDARSILRFPDFCDCCEARCGTEYSACPTCGRAGRTEPLVTSTHP